jgi:hypothetical protein
MQPIPDHGGQPVRLHFPFGRRGLLAATAVAAGVVYWRVRVARREADDREWDEDMRLAVEQGVSAGRDGADPPAEGGV